jgi:hypothetical protein
LSDCSVRCEQPAPNGGVPEKLIAGSRPVSGFAGVCIGEHPLRKVDAAHACCLDVPPLAEAGVEGFDFPIWYGIWAPARTPPEIVSKLARDISNVLATAELLEWLNRHDADPLRMTQAEFAAFVESECERATVLLSSD